MIKKHNSLVKSEQVINSFINSMHQHENLDGVVEVFKEKDRQGYMIKLYKNYDIESDLCIWVYEDLDRKIIHTIIDTHKNCDTLNCCTGKGILCNQYPIVIDIKKKIVANLIDDVYDHYSKDMRI